MVSQVFKDITNYFESLDYQLIPTDSETVKMYATFHLNTLYLINVIELSEQYAFDRERYFAYRELTKKQFSNAGADKTCLLNLLLIENPDMIYKEVNYQAIDDADFYDAHWIVDTAYHELIIPRKQLKHILGLEESLQLNIHQEAAAKYKLHEKNKTVFLTGVINISMMIAFILMLFVGSTNEQETLMNFGALHINNLFSKGEYWRLITYYIAHSDPVYLLSNAFLILFFGSKLEKYITTFQMCIIVMGSLVFAGLTVVAVHMVTGSSMMSFGGASIAYGLMGSVLIYSKFTNKSIDGIHDYTLLILFLVGIAIGLSDTRINTLLHIGGFIGGVIMTLFILRSYRHEIVVEEKSSNIENS